MVAGGRDGEKRVREFGMNVCTPRYSQWIRNKDLLCGTLSTLHSVMGQPDGRGVWRRMVHIQVSLSPFAVHLKLSHY